MSSEAPVPTYVYRCQQCGEVIERRQRFSDEPLTVCEACGGELRKVLQPVGIIFKGSGFYVTDRRNGGAAKTSERGDGSEEKKSSETKADKTEKSESTSTSSSSSTASSSSESSSSKSSDSATPASTPSKSE